MRREREREGREKGICYVTSSHGSGAGKSEICRTGVGWRPEEEPMPQVGSDVSLETEFPLPQGKSFFVSQSLQLIRRGPPTPEREICFAQSL